MLAPCLRAQGAQDIDNDPPPPPNLYTLHVYTNLLQVSTIVLDPSNHPVTSLSANQFSLSVDAGPAFHPTQMRMGGADPLFLTILIDASGGEDEIVHKLSDALAGMTPGYLHSTDQLLFVALDCKLVRSAAPIPATPEAIRHSLAAVLNSPGLHGTKTHGACSHTTHLWDTIITVDKILHNMPGRRVLLIISSGNDHQSQYSFSEASEYNVQDGITVFGMRDPDGPMVGDSPGLANMRRGGLPVRTSSSVEDPFDLLCRGNGGLVLDTRSWSLVKSLQSFITMLRGRYILEFPRPENSTAGIHHLEVVTQKKDALVLTTGVTAPLPDAAALADPNTIPVAPSPAKQGPRKPLSHIP